MSPNFKKKQTSKKKPSQPGKSLKQKVKQGGTFESSTGVPLYLQNQATTSVSSTRDKRQTNGEKIPVSPLVNELSAIWFAGKKGKFFHRLRNLGTCDPEINRFVKENLYGDDYWLAQNILDYGPESEWPIHLKVEREMKPWGKGKGRVFQILRDANKCKRDSIELLNTLYFVFDPYSDDFWLAENLMEHGREDIWPFHLKIERKIKAWPGVNGSPEGILSFIKSQPHIDPDSVVEYLQQLRIEYLSQSKPNSQISAIEKVLHALYAQVAKTQAPGITAPQAGWTSGSEPSALLAGTKVLTDPEKEEARLVLTGKKKSLPFIPYIPGKGFYEDRIRNELNAYVKQLYKQYVEGVNLNDRFPQKKIIPIAKVSKESVDNTFKSYKVGKPFKWNVTIDDFYDNIDLRAYPWMTPKQIKQVKETLPKVFVYELIHMNKNIQNINKEHNAIINRKSKSIKIPFLKKWESEASIIKRIVNDYIKKPNILETLNRIQQFWPAGMDKDSGKILIQRFKKRTDKGNQELLWVTFQSLIHEYLHTLAHSKYKSYATSFGESSFQYNIFIEGVNSVLTEIVWSTVNKSKLREKIEGPALASKPFDLESIPISRHRYPSYNEAMKLIKVVGIRNLYAAYFLGRVDLIGKEH